MAEYLITGGAGFIGSHLVEALAKEGRKIAVIDNFLTGKNENIAPFASKIEFFQGDIRDRELLKKALTGIRIVFHEAALPSVPRSIKDPWSTHQNNVEGTLNLLIACREAGVQRVVYAGSSSAYGNTPILPKVETLAPNPCSPYAASKLAGEHYCQVFTKVYGLETVILRYFNVFGPRQDPNSTYAAVIPKFIVSLLNNRPSIIYGDGEQSRDFTYIDNVVAANLLAAQANNVAGQVFNIACGQQTSLNQILDFLAKFLGKTKDACYQEYRSGDVLHSVADIGLAKQYLNYIPKVCVYEGLEKTALWFQQSERK